MRHKETGCIVFFLVSGAFCPARADTAMDGASYGRFHEIGIYDLIKSSDFIGTGLLVLEKPSAAEVDHQIAVADKNNSMVKIPVTFELKPKSYYKIPIREKGNAPIAIEYVYNYNSLNVYAADLFAEYLFAAKEHSAGISSVFFGNQTSAGFNCNFIVQENKLNEIGVREIDALGGNVSYAAINQEILQGKSRFARGYAIGLIFGSQASQTTASEDNMLKPDNADLAQNWVASLPDSIFSPEQKQTLYISNNVYNLHDPDLDEAWLFSAPIPAISFKEGDVSTYTYARYLLDLGFNMLTHDFPNDTKSDAFVNSRTQLGQIIGRIKDPGLRQEEMVRLDEIFPNSGPKRHP